MCSGALIWLFSPAWDAVKLTLKAGFICPFVVDDPTEARQSWLPRPYACPSSTYPLRRKPAFLPMVIKLTCLCVCVRARARVCEQTRGASSLPAAGRVPQCAVDSVRARARSTHENLLLDLAWKEGGRMNWCEGGRGRDGASIESKRRREGWSVGRIGRDAEGDAKGESSFAPVLLQDRSDGGGKDAGRPELEGLEGGEGGEHRGVDGEAAWPDFAAANGFRRQRVGRGGPLGEEPERNGAKPDFQLAESPQQRTRLGAV